MFIKGSYYLECQVLRGPCACTDGVALFLYGVAEYTGWFKGGPGGAMTNFSRHLRNSPHQTRFSGSKYHSNAVLCRDLTARSYSAAQTP